MPVLGPWSYSALSTYETCPKKYQHERILEDVEQIGSSQADYGTSAHKAFEELFLEGKPLPGELRHHGQVLDRIAATRNVEVFPEHKMALTVDLEPTDFYAADAWTRGIADLILVGENSAACFDWKFGRPHDNFGQLELMSLMIFCYWPRTMKVSTAFYWAKEKRLSHRTFTREGDMTNIYNDFFSRSSRMRADEKFTPRPNFLCRKWCPVKTCKFNGG